MSNQISLLTLPSPLPNPEINEQQAENTFDNIENESSEMRNVDRNDSVNQLDLLNRNVITERIIERQIIPYDPPSKKRKLDYESQEIIPTTSQNLNPIPHQVEIRNNNVDMVLRNQENQVIRFTNKIQDLNTRMLNLETILTQNDNVSQEQLNQGLQSLSNALVESQQQEQQYNAQQFTQVLQNLQGYEHTLQQIQQQSSMSNDEKNQLQLFIENDLVRAQNETQQKFEQFINQQQIIANSQQEQIQLLQKNNLLMNNLNHNFESIFNQVYFKLNESLKQYANENQQNFQMEVRNMNTQLIEYNKEQQLAVRKFQERLFQEMRLVDTQDQEEMKRLYRQIYKQQFESFKQEWIQHFETVSKRSLEDTTVSNQLVLQDDENQRQEIEKMREAQEIVIQQQTEMNNQLMSSLQNQQNQFITIFKNSLTEKFQNIMNFQQNKYREMDIYNQNNYAELKNLIPYLNEIPTQQQVKDLNLNIVELKNTIVGLNDNVENQSNETANMSRLLALTGQNFNVSKQNVISDKMEIEYDQKPPDDYNPDIDFFIKQNMEEYEEEQIEKRRQELLMRKRQAIIEHFNHIASNVYYNEGNHVSWALNPFDIWEKQYELNNYSENDITNFYQNQIQTSQSQENKLEMIFHSVNLLINIFKKYKIKDFNNLKQFLTIKCSQQKATEENFEDLNVLDHFRNFDLNLEHLILKTNEYSTQNNIQIYLPTKVETDYIKLTKFQKYLKSIGVSDNTEKVGGTILNRHYHHHAGKGNVGISVVNKNEISSNSVQKLITSHEIKNHRKTLFKYKNSKHIESKSNFGEGISIAKFDDGVVELHTYSQKINDDDINVLLHFISRTKGELFEEEKKQLKKKGKFTANFHKDVNMFLKTIDFNTNQQTYFVIPSEMGGSISPYLLKSKKFHNILRARI